MTVADRATCLGTAEREAAERVLASGMLTQGAEVAAFETEFAETMSGRECVALASGTSALHLGLMAAGIGPGDEVIVPAFTFAATANAIVQAGARPVFADIDPATYCLDPASASAAVTSRTAAIIPVHLYGHPANMDAINRLARDHGLLVLEDACQAQGARYRDAPVGTLADLAAVSFYPTKTMTTGEGGMLVCRDPQTAHRARALRNQGMSGPGSSPTTLGYNARMTDLAAAIGRVQLRRVDDFLELRRAHAARWDAALRRRARAVPLCRGGSGVPALHDPVPRPGRGRGEPHGRRSGNARLLRHPAAPERALSGRRPADAAGRRGRCPAGALGPGRAAPGSLGRGVASSGRWRQL